MVEGEYLKGKQWNIKSYDENGNLLYELKNGKGKEYNINGQLQCEIEYSYGKLCGKIIYYENNKIIKIIDIESIIDDKINRNIKIFNKDGTLKYEGEYSFDKKWNGKGYDRNGNITYELINGMEKLKNMMIMTF